MLWDKIESKNISLLVENIFVVLGENAQCITRVVMLLCDLTLTRPQFIVVLNRNFSAAHITCLRYPQC